MIQVLDKLTESIPEWMLNYLVNSDSQGLSQDEVNLIDDYFAELEKYYQNLYGHPIEFIFCASEETYFSWNNIGGSGSTCVDGTILVVADYSAG